MPSKIILEMDESEAKLFFLKSESYFNVPLPDYIDLESIIAEAVEKLGTSKISDIQYSKHEKQVEEDKKERGEEYDEIDLLKDLTSVNLRLMSNKDGAYSWRPFTLIHPIIYVDFVNTLTEKENWNLLKSRFIEFQRDDRIICTSIPVESTGRKSDSEEQILSWWEKLEQEQLKLALNYSYCIHTDITDCYPSIYTHTIPWSIHGKEWAKVNRNDKSALGNKLDNKIQSLQGGQTNGIPQGSVLMDLIAEIVLGYADFELLKLADEEKLEDFKILRYRDDYRIFSNRKDTAEKLMKLLSEVLLDLNLKINSKKTFLSEDIVLDGIKEDKLYWTTRSANLFEYYPYLLRKNNKIKVTKKRLYKLTLQKHLFEIKILADKFPNCGQLNKALIEFYNYRIINLNTEKHQIADIDQLISITTSIMVKNPKTTQSCVAILHKLFEFINDNEKVEEIINSILKKFDSLPNADLVEIWLQNISVRIDRTKHYKNILSQKIADSNIQLWNNKWLKSNQRINESLLINDDRISELQPEYTLNDFNIYPD